MPDEVRAQSGRRPSDNQPSGEVLAEFGFEVRPIFRKGVPAPIQLGQRWVVEQTKLVDE